MATSSDQGEDEYVGVIAQPSTWNDGQTYVRVRSWPGFSDSTVTLVPPHVLSVANSGYANGCATNPVELVYSELGKHTDCASCGYPAALGCLNSKYDTADWPQAASPQNCGHPDLLGRSDVDRQNSNQPRYAEGEVTECGNVQSYAGAEPLTASWGPALGIFEAARTTPLDFAGFDLHSENKSQVEARLCGPWHLSELNRSGLKEKSASADYRATKLQIHRQRHTPSPRPSPRPSQRTRVYCPQDQCNASCSRKSDLERHLRTIHGFGDTLYACAQGGCGHTVLERVDKMMEHCRDQKHTRYRSIDTKPLLNALTEQGPKEINRARTKYLYICTEQDCHYEKLSVDNTTRTHCNNPHHADPTCLNISIVMNRKGIWSDDSTTPA